MLDLRRREFIIVLGGAASWPLAVRAQQPERMRRISVLMTTAADDSEGQARMVAFVQGLQQLGWTNGRNVRIEIRWSAADADRIRKYAAELVALAPDVILAPGSATVAPLLQATRTVPIVFVHLVDPVGAGYVKSLARPGGNATGFTPYEYGLSAKWLELLKQIAPGRNPSGGHSRSRHIRWARSVRCDSVRCAVAWGGGNCGQRARCQRNRGRDYVLRARGQWRSDRDGKRVSNRLSEVDR